MTIILPTWLFWFVVFAIGVNVILTCLQIYIHYLTAELTKLKRDHEGQATE